MPADTDTQLNLEAVSGLTLLLAEDDVFSRDNLAEFLTRITGDLLVAETVAEAPGLLEGSGADVALVGLSGDGLAGAEAVRRIRERHPGAVVFALVDPDRRGLLDVALELEADRLLARPVLPDTLLAALARAARTVAMYRRLAEADDAVRIIMDTAPIYVLMAQEGEAVYVNRGMLAYLGYDTYEDFQAGARAVGDFVSRMDDEPWEGGDGLDTRRAGRPPGPRAHAHHPQPARSIGDARASSWSGSRNSPPPGRHLHDPHPTSPSLSASGAACATKPATDPLTGALNRRRFLQMLAEQEQSAMHGATHYSLIMLDVDHFKRSQRRVRPRRGRRGAQGAGEAGAEQRAQLRRGLPLGRRGVHGPHAGF